MNKRQIKKREDKYKRLMFKRKPDIDQLGRDLAEFHNCSVEQAIKGLTSCWNMAAIDDLKSLGVTV